ncbi:M24 family metallopeptidase [Rhodococcoides fascians]|uniref:M24 family metallopeptidase n=1 Tax=Rhodococcoides fascians TaxID=1828 RepID=UPI00055EAF42|nr:MULTISPECIES: Xaa-Pro peptidase family protein [Rhodococcus]OZE94519.1 aminopeptidase P family protein [Rhodococcus sp. 15-1189-1-1a]OZF09602.1 aminopeptidase P family protein [Rhodococcus sp. 14-2686-1-2]
MPVDHSGRRAALRRSMEANDLESLLVTDLLNIRYLTGFTGSNAALIVSVHDSPGREDNTVVCTDGRYVTQVAHQVPDLRAVIDRASASYLLGGELAPRNAPIGFESHVVTVDQHRAWTGLDSALNLVRSPGLVEDLRMVKDEYEVGLLRDACRAADDAFAVLLGRGSVAAGRTELEVARELESLMVEHGADGISFETIVAAGPNSAVPHHRPTPAVLAAGDFVKFDFGALVGGYHSDMTRTVVLGAPQDWQKDLYALVLQSQTAGRDALAPGVSTASVDAASRSVIEDAGYGEFFLHGLGHGVGLEIHEAPGIARTSTGTLLSGAAVTVEPGVYFSGRGGVRIEDTLIVRDGGPELLTMTSKELTLV